MFLLPLFAVSLFLVAVGCNYTFIFRCRCYVNHVILSPCKQLFFVAVVSASHNVAVAPNNCTFHWRDGY